MQEEVKAGVWMSLCKQGAFLVLGTALISLSKTHVTVGGGGLMAVLSVLLSWGLYVLSPALAVSLTDSSAP